MLPEEIDEILQRYLKNECTEAERKLVESWFEAIREDRSELDDQTRRAVHRKLWSKLKKGTAPERTYQPWKVGRIAATLLFLMLSTFLLVRYFTSGNTGHDLAMLDKMISVVNSGDTLQKIELSDGSIVSLEAGGEVRYPEVFRDKREVYLSGEAFFEVARDASHPFLVYANEVTTKVLGTSFRIKAYANEKEIIVAVRTGKVSVATQLSGKDETREEIILTPNQQIIYDRRENLTLKKLVDDPHMIVQQPAQKTTYTDVPVIEIFKALQERYGVQIEYDAHLLSGCTLMSADIGEEGLYEQLEIICNALGAHYTRSEFSIVIESGGCR